MSTIEQYEEDFKTYQAESDHTVAHFEEEYPELDIEMAWKAE